MSGVHPGPGGILLVVAVVDYSEEWRWWLEWFGSMVAMEILVVVRNGGTGNTTGDATQMVLVVVVVPWK